MDKDEEERVWEEILRLMPKCDICGQGMKPGVFPCIGEVLVCVNCSTIHEVDDGYVDEIIHNAYAAATAKMN